MAKRKVCMYTTNPARAVWERAEPSRSVEGAFFIPLGSAFVKFEEVDEPAFKVGDRLKREFMDKSGHVAEVVFAYVDEGDGFQKYFCKKRGFDRHGMTKAVYYTSLMETEMTINYTVISN